ncbi:MAG: B12-binding domain-containing radical SAM protein [Spirochaetales bacterium]|nr:B12-binding domain-containing radical SAM protein [Spirochaetales bacterium]
MFKTNKYRLRLIIPAFPNFNIYSFTARETTSVGPLSVATAANQLQNWDVEVIDENNCRSSLCPKDKHGLPDHKKIQQERPADVVGFYGSITTSIPRLYKLAALYNDLGAKTVAGGKHIENLPEEALQNNVDVAVFGEGEITIKELLLAWQNNKKLDQIKGIAFLKHNTMHKTKQRPLIHNFDALPYPDFNLLLYAKIKYYPVNRIRGCNMKCEFCAVKEKARYGSPERLMEQIKHLVETRNARRFFETSDHFATNRKDAIEFCNQLAEYQKKIGKRLYFVIQTRITDAKYPELLAAMKKANFYMVCIGYESPIDEELRAMNKGYKSKDLIKWTKAFHDHGLFIHGMFIFGYPQKENFKISLPLKEKIKRFRSFIKKSKIDTLQVVQTIPLPGTELRQRLREQGRLYPLDKIGWEYYDGQFPLFEPDNGVSPEKMQQAVFKEIMGKFYRFHSFWHITTNILFHFPRLVFSSAFTIITFRVKHIINAFLIWKKKYFRNQLVRFGGYIILKNWIKKLKTGSFLEKLNKAKFDLKGS